MRNARQVAPVAAVAIRIIYAGAILSDCQQTYCHHRNFDAKRHIQIDMQTDRQMTGMAIQLRCW